MRKFKLRRREIILIAGFWLVGCALLTGVFYTIIFSNLPADSQPGKITAPQATYTLVHTQVTAKSMEYATESKLSLWAEDAQLYSVAGTWEQTELGRVGEPTIWTYRYYSPGQKRLFFITVNPYGETMGISHGERVYKPPIPISAEDWVLDSAEAVNLWLNYGGSAMLTALPGSYVITQLKASTAEDPLTWTVSGYDQPTKHFHTIFINAKTKEIIKISSSLNQRG